MLSNLLRESQRLNLKKYFQKQLNDLKSSWKDIKTLLSVKESPSKVPSTITDNGQFLIKPKETTNIFNKYFANADSVIQSSMKYSKNNFHDFSLHLI